MSLQVHLLKFPTALCSLFWKVIGWYSCNFNNKYPQGYMLWCHSIFKSPVFIQHDYSNWRTKLPKSNLTWTEEKPINIVERYCVPNLKSSKIAVLCKHICNSFPDALKCNNVHDLTIHNLEKNNVHQSKVWYLNIKKKPASLNCYLFMM